MASSTVGSQKLLQRAVSSRPELLRSALRRAGALGRGEAIEWVSPLAREGFREHRDMAAIRRLGLESTLCEPLSGFWPARGPVWDGLALVGSWIPLLVEAKAHIPEAASPGSRASATSLKVIEESLVVTRRKLAPRSKASWSGVFYQYANRLAFQYYLRQRNHIDSRLLFLYFTNAADVDGPATEMEWHGAVRLIHAVLGLRPDLTDFGVYEAFVDARSLTDVA